MALSINQTVTAQALPTSSDLLIALQTNQSQAQDAPAPASSKGKLFSKDAPTLTPTTSVASNNKALTQIMEAAEELLLMINESEQNPSNPTGKKTASSTGKIAQFAPTQSNISPITPITPPASKQDLIDLIAAMMVAVQAMEVCLSKLMTIINTAEASMRTDTANAMAYSETQNIAAAGEAAKKAASAEETSGVMKILGYIAAAIVCLVHSEHLPESPSSSSS